MNFHSNYAVKAALNKKIKKILNEISRTMTIVVISLVNKLKSSGIV